MNALRAVVITRRFWPLAQGDERLAAELSQQLARHGTDPTVVTARFDTRWPAQIHCRELVVHRLPFPRSPFGWGTMRYMIALSRWLRRNRPDIDVVLVFGMSLDAYAAVGALQSSGIPVIIRVENADLGEALDSSILRRRAHILRRCHSAAAMVAATSGMAHQLTQLGFSAANVHCIPDGVALATNDRSPTSQLAARAALANVNEDLRVGMNSPVVTYLGPLEPIYELTALVEAWGIVSQRFPHARLWLVGDGSDRDRLYRTIQDCDLLGRVLLPGTFDEMDEVLLASDLVVAPSAADQSLTLLRAMAAEVPVLVASSVENDNLVCPGQRGRTFTPGGAASLAAEIDAALSDPLRGQALAANARDYVQQFHSLETMALKYHQLFQSVTGSSRRMVP